MRPDVNEKKAAGVEAEALSRALRLLPFVLELYETSPLHFLHPVRALCDQVLPSLINGQFRLHFRDKQPAAFVNWAWLSPEASARYAQEYTALDPGEWQSGPELWFCEIVVRDGMMHTLLRDLQRNVFPDGAYGRWRRIGPSGELMGIGETRIPKVHRSTTSA